jgi:hypothetical protein
MVNCTRAAAVAVALLIASTVNAQTQASTRVALSPPGADRWDLAGHVTWLGENQSRVAAPWDGWFSAASFGASVGYYVGPHIKFDVDLATSTRGHVYGLTEFVTVPPYPAPIPLSRDHYFRTSTMNTGLVYQFFENSWMHPFVGAGVALERSEHRSANTQDLRYGPGGVPLIVPPNPRTTVSYRVRPAVTIGFKGYVSERAFIRTDLRTSVASTGVQQLGWRAGVGVDF